MPNLTVSSDVDSFMQSPSYAAMRALLGLRETLTAPLTLFVRSDGNDSNTGLTNDAAGAFLTWQGAIDAYAARYDDARQAVTIRAGQLGQTFTIASPLRVKKCIGNGTLILDFNGGTLQSSSGHSATEGLILVSNVQGLTIKGCSTIHNNTWAGWAWHLQATNASQVDIESHTFGIAASGSFGGHILAELNAMVVFTNSYTINGGGLGVSHLLSRDDAIIQTPTSSTVTITGTPAFGTFAQFRAAKIRGFETIYSGAVASGTRKHDGTGYGVLNHFGGNATYPFPGDVPGIVNNALVI